MITKKPFGVTKDGVRVTAYTITNGRGIVVTVLDYGATLQSVVLPCREGPLDVVLGYDTIEEYEQNDGYLGASIGRFAGRIPDAMLRIGDRIFPVTANEGKHHLHGGRMGLDRKVWTAGIENESVVLTVISPDGEEGYPGNVLFTASYTLTDQILTISLSGESDRFTAWNPTNHAYWNLDGHASGDTRSHRLEIPAERYVPVGSDGIPTGKATSTARTRFDFRTLREIGDTYDNSYILSGNPIRLRGKRGIEMIMRTNCSAVQFYNASFLSERKGKCGAVYRPFGAVCLEPEGRQTLPGMPVETENVLTPARPAERVTKYHFIYEER